MPRRVLLIESTSNSLGERSSWAALNLIPESTPWTSLSPGRLCERHVDLIVAQASQECANATDFFYWLGDNRIGKPVLAIVSADGQLLRRAARVADDFIVAPVSTQELQHRIGRILGEEAPPNVSERLSREFGLAGLVGRHPGFLR